MAMPRLVESTKIYDVIEAVNKKALSEKQGGGRPPFWEMVFWWTRKPLVGARATVMASVLPDTIDPRDFLIGVAGDRYFSGVGRDRRDRRALRSVEGNKIEIEGTPHRFPPKIPEKYRSDFESKKLLDPFAGFGSIPLEAMRLGMDVTAVELLPTAYVFLKAVLEYPAKYGKDLVESVKKWGNWVVEKLKEDEDIWELYDDDVAVYIGTWEVRCPHCSRWTPLVANWWLARVKDSSGKYERLVFFKPVKDGSEIGIGIVDLNRVHGDVSEAAVDARRGTIEIGGARYEVPSTNIYARGSKAWCLHCGMEIRFVDDRGNHYSERNGKDVEWYVKWALKKYNEGDERFARQRLLVKVKVADGDLVFEPATRKDNEKLERAKEKLKQIWGDPDIPIESIPSYGHVGGGLRFPTYAVDKWYQFFNPRQLLTLVKLVKLIREAGKRVEEERLAEGWSREDAFKFAEAVTTYLAIALCKYADYSSLVAGWNQSLIMGHSLSMRGIAMMWNWDDMNPWANWTGTYLRSLNTLTGGLSYLVSAVSNTKGRVQILLDDATVLSNIPPEEKFDVVVTDPPYMDDVAYTELSDFYYVWLKRALSDSDGRRLVPRFLPEAFFRKVGAKYREIETQWQEFAKREVSTNPGRFQDVENRDEHAEKHFRELFTQAMISIRNRLKEDGIAAIYFAHTSFEAWALLLDAIRKAGFMVTGAFPAATESKDRVTGRGKMTMDTSIVVVCRPNPEQRDIQITSLIPLIRKSAEAYARTLATKEIPGRDILIGTMIGAIREVTKYSRILTPAGELSMEDVLRDYVYPLIGSVMAEVYAGVSGAKEPVRDSVALFYLLAKVAFGGKGGTNPFTTDDVITLCRASKLDVDTARTILIESGSENETEEEEVEEEGGSKVASSKTVRLAELKSKEPVKIRSFLLARNISPDSAVKKLRHAVDAYHLLLFYASAYDNQRIRFEYEELRGVYPDVVSEAVKLMKVVARMKNGFEMELARRFLQAVEGLG